MNFNRAVELRIDMIQQLNLAVGNGSVAAWHDIYTGMEAAGVEDGIDHILKFCDANGLPAPSGAEREILGSLVWQLARHRLASPPVTVTTPA